MDNSIVSEQAAEAGDVQTVTMTGHSFPVIPQEEGAADENVEISNSDIIVPTGKSAEDQESDEESSEDQDSETQSSNSEKKSWRKSDKEWQEMKERNLEVDKLKMQVSALKWERDHPAVTTAEYREAWEEIVKKKGHLVKSGDLTYDDLWTLIRKESKPSNSARVLKEQELNIGSVPAASKTVVSGQEIDPDVYAAMKRKGWTDEQIRLSA